MHQNGRNTDPAYVAPVVDDDDDASDAFLELAAVGAAHDDGQRGEPAERARPARSPAASRTREGAPRPTPAPLPDVRALRRQDVYGPARRRQGVPRLLKSRGRETEDGLDRDLAGAAARVGSPNVITVNGSQGGVGKSVLAFALGDALSRPPARLNVVAVDIDHDSGALPDLVSDDARREHTLMTLLASSPGEGSGGADPRPAPIPFPLLRRFTSPTPSGMLILPGPRLPEERRTLTIDQLETVVALLGSADVIILDCGAGITSERARWAIRTADQRVMLARPRFTGAASTARAFSEGVPVQNTCLVLNRVLPTRDQNLEHIRHAFARAELDNPIEVPECPQLEAAMERAAYRLHDMPARVRLPVKQLAVRVAEALR